MKVPTPATIERRLAKIGPLQIGTHSDHKAMCIMEAVAFIAGEPWSDAPACASPVISTFLRNWNDALDNERRDILLRPFISKLIGTNGDAALENRRATMAGDWLVRVHTPAWLKLAGLTVHAEALASLPVITNFAQCPSLMPALIAARTDAAAAWDAAKAAAWAGARDAAWAGARDAAWDAAWDALKATIEELQQSAVGLVERMIAARADPAVEAA